MKFFWSLFFTLTMIHDVYAQDAFISLQNIENQYKAELKGLYDSAFLEISRTTSGGGGLQDKIQVVADELARLTFLTYASAFPIINSDHALELDFHQKNYYQYFVMELRETNQMLFKSGLVFLSKNITGFEENILAPTETLDSRPEAYFKHTKTETVVPPILLCYTYVLCSPGVVLSSFSAIAIDLVRGLFFNKVDWKGLADKGLIVFPNEVTARTYRIN